MIRVPLFDLKFLKELAACGVGTSNRRHSIGRAREGARPSRAAPAGNDEHDVAQIQGEAQIEDAPWLHGFIPGSLPHADDQDMVKNRTQVAGIPGMTDVDGLEAMPVKQL